MSTYEDTPDPAGESVFAYKLRELTRNVRDLLAWRREVDTERALLKQDAQTLGDRIDGLEKAVDALRKVLLGFAFTVAGSAIVFALTVLIATGKIGGK